MAMKSYKARGIVLGTLKYGEKGVIVHMLTDTYGRQSYMVQGVRPTAKGSKMALLQPMFAVEFEGLHSDKMSMHRMKDIVPGIVLQSTPFDVRKSTMALFMAEVLYRLIHESEPNEELFDFIWGSVAALDAMGEGVANFHLWFMANLSRPLGFSPDLSDLGMKDAEFRVDISQTAGFMPTGCDEVAFMFNANKGGELREIGKVISGGELSRVMLAIKSLITSNSLLPTIIFDEIDSEQKE